MDRVRALAFLNGKILVTYSRRTVDSLRAVLPLRLVLPHLEPALARNVEKEVRKDALVIRCAGEALASGSPPGQAAVRRLFDATKAIDQDFLEGVDAFPVRIAIRYEDIAPVRLQRIECLLEAAHRILAAWRAGVGLRAALGATYPQPDLERLLHQLLRLYAVETRAISRSVRLPGLLAPLRELAAERLFDVMNEWAWRLAAELARGVYHPARLARLQA
ncbi:MAG: hypothetical protein OEP48_14245 [Betaproteobacteria bacterium]|nr:hypothetical protein [Betaproteobacteria bacterium]MDH3436449.1 hypothetical protein [Betaproteobacteria bacterium]